MIRRKTEILNLYVQKILPVYLKGHNARFPPGKILAE